MTYTNKPNKSYYQKLKTNVSIMEYRPEDVDFILDNIWGGRIKKAVKKAIIKERREWRGERLNLIWLVLFFGSVAIYQAILLI